ncbi:MAG: hypothetical protein ACLSG8_10465 [Barnesiella sp.]
MNQWAQNNFKNIDLSFGISEYDDQRTGGATTRTDYSYKVSKTLFDDRFKVVIGGSFSPDATTNEDLKENLIDDISPNTCSTKGKTCILRYSAIMIMKAYWKRNNSNGSRVCRT